MSYPINVLTLRYSVGEDTYDNEPIQKEAADFDEFEQAILAYRSPAKGKNYFAGPLSFGPHDRLEKYKYDGYFRLASHALPRRFLATDQDGYRNVTTFKEVLSDVSCFRGFGYTTWSYADKAPRTRMVFELSRDVTRPEGIALGRAFDRMIKATYGDDAVKHDASVYQNEQPCYSPGHDAQVFHFGGRPLDVDDILQRYPEPSTRLTETDYEAADHSPDHPSYSRLNETSLLKVLGLISCEDEPVWHAVSIALARVYGGGGREIFHRFSRGEFWGKPYKEYDGKEVDKKFERSIGEVRSRPRGYGVKYLIELSGLSYGDVDFEEGTGDHSLLHMATLPNGAALSSQPSSNSVLFSALSRNNKPIQITENLHSVLAHHGVTVRYNQVSKRCEILIPGLTCVLDEADNTALTTVMDYAVKAGMTSARIPEMVEAMASKSPFCPVQTYIESVPWDGICRFAQFIGQLKCGNATLSAVLFRKWLIQAVGAVYEPNGIANAGVIVLTGAQGVGKTRLFADLTSGVSRAFLEGQTLNPADKDSVMSAASHWVVELGELDSTFRKADLAQLKAFITRQQDKLRRPYARRDSVFPRRTVFAGTVNDFQFLNDPTGNRRFWPIDIHSITRDTTINYQQLWAQVKSWYDNGERWYLSDAELKLLNQYSETFLVSDPDVEALLSNYDFYNCPGWKATSMNTICAHIRLEKPTKAQTMRLAEAIRKYNGGQRPKLVNGINHHYVPDTGLMGRSPVPWVQTTGSGT
jgi:putative DNA primase/helicase